jgi:hypothetical protein
VDAHRMVHLPVVTAEGLSNALSLADCCRAWSESVHVEGARVGASNRVPTVTSTATCEAPLLNPTRPGRTEDGLAKDLSLADSRPVWSEPMHVDGARICASSDVSRASRRGCTAGWHRNALSQSQPFLRCQSQFTLLSA